MNTLIALSVLAVITLFLGIFNLKKGMLPVIVTGLIVAFSLNLKDWGQSRDYFSHMYFSDNFSIAFGAVMICATLLILLTSAQYYKADTANLEGIFAIILFCLIGGVVMVSSANLITFFIGIEILSIALYLLAASHKSSKRSHEAGMKYFLMGSFASAFLLFGITLLYGASGSMQYTDISSYLNTHSNAVPLLAQAGLLLVVIGMAFKVAAVPFHFWAPDVYHGSPTLISAFMITTVKVAGFAAFLRLTMLCFGNQTSLWVGGVTVISALSVLIGNFAALAQTSPKRMLAYSSIAHTGYLLIALVSLETGTASYVMYYSIAYVMANLAAFLVLIVMKQSVESVTFDSFNGLAKRNPVLSFCMTVSMLSLTGIPPLAGFMGKYLVFTSAFTKGNVGLVIIAIIGSVVSIFYYFRPIVNMYFKKQDEATTIQTSKLSLFVLVLITALSLIVGLLPGILLSVKF